jgi:pantoate--beta-alanine ligase
VQILTTIETTMEICQQAEQPLGLVPTMGALHEGHISLVREARKENATVVASIFVNPSQFGAGEDFEKYPRPFERDVDLLRNEGVDIIFAPTIEDMYPSTIETYVDVGNVAAPLEGTHRPGHFRGVATVVTKLFTITRPNRAYFGEKDGQQVAVVRRLNDDLNLGVELIVMPTVREPSGLAMSSRNNYMGKTERISGGILYQALCSARERFDMGERNAKTLRQIVLSVLRLEPSARIEYVSIADADTMEELDTVDRRTMISLAVSIKHTRLIDNVILVP